MRAGRSPVRAGEVESAGRSPVRAGELVGVRAWRSRVTAGRSRVPAGRSPVRVGEVAGARGGGRREIA